MEDNPRLTKNTNESFEIESSFDAEEKTVKIEISAENYFGARHGIETIFQLMEFDELFESFIILTNLTIKDFPEFRHRGISLDTARNFITIDSIKRTIEGMAHSKVIYLLINLLIQLIN